MKITMIRIFYLISLVSLLSACSSVPPYQEFGFGGGYKEKKVSDGTYELYYAGNAFATVKGVAEAWHRRAAELCENSSYEHKFTFDGKKQYNVYAGGYMPIGMNFPEVIGVVTCSTAKSS